MRQETADAFSQTPTQKIATVAAGLGGMSMKLSTVAEVAQQIGMIVGCILVCGQAVLFFRGFYRKLKKGRPANDS